MIRMGNRPHEQNLDKNMTLSLYEIIMIDINIIHANFYTKYLPKLIRPF